jgi:hypothetical protein
MMSVGNSYGSLPVNTVAPAVTGTASVGQTLTTTNGTWTGAPAPTFTYQWQRNTSNISGATSSTYVIQAEDATNTLRCVVTATNPLGAVSANSNSTATVPLVIGQAFGGGYYAGLISTAGNDVADFYLIVGPLASAQNNSKQFKTSNTGSDPTSVIDGPTNSATMNSGTYPAAQFCEGLTIGGYSDWYMPAKNELEICYYSFRPTVNSNNTSSGTNTNAVPSRPSNYTSTDPPQTSLSLFIEGGSEAFTSSGIRYCSSTQQSSTSAWLQQFSNGSQTFFDKDGSYIVRAVRRVAI